MGRSRELAELATAYDGGSLGFRNRIINGDMRIDQRNNGASVTISTAALNYTVDRWAAFGQATDGVYTVSRSTTVPSSAGFVNSLVAICTTADTSISATNRYFLNQNIEGNNSADLQFGTAAAQAVTLSFWVRSSLTGTYCAAVLNGDGTRSYVAEYTISTADTWEYKTITVPGDTTGTWSTNETTGITLRFALAIGSNFQTTANTWAAGNFNATANQVNWMSSSSSRTFFITGVQLEAGSVATPFERRDYGRELIMCQRYYQLNIPTLGWSTATNNVAANISGAVSMRAAPTATLINGSNGIGDFTVSYRNITAITGLGNTDTYGGEVNMTPATSTTANKGQGIRGSAIALSAEL